MALGAPPAPVSTNPLRKMAGDLRAERRAPVPFPPGATSHSIRRTHRMLAAPLGLLLELYARHGPVFTVRVLHARHVFALGPEANHHMLVAGAENFRWRTGGFADLIPLLGDGLLTVDGAFHRRSRRVMLPAFHRERLEAAAAVVHEEADRAVGAWADGMGVDVYAWARRLALRVALRALFGLDPDRRPAGLDAAAEFERALDYYGREYWLQVLRGPGTPWAALQTARARLDGLIRGEIAERRRTGARGEDLLSLLLDARDEDGAGLDDAHVRDEVMTLLFAGHDTTTATLSFLLHALARHPGVDARLAREAEAAGPRPGYAALMGGGLPELDMALDETLRLFPPAWIGPRRAVATFTVCGVTVPGGVPVNYSSWASHRLPDVWDEPDAFRPERFAPAARARIPKGAYVPFGGGSRTCIGMRFGQLEVKALAVRILRDWRLELPAHHRLHVAQTPTLGPKGGLPMTVRAR